MNFTSRFEDQLHVDLFLCPYAGSEQSQGQVHGSHLEEQIEHHEYS